MAIGTSTPPTGCPSIEAVRTLKYGLAGRPCIISQSTPAYWKISIGAMEVDGRPSRMKTTVTSIIGPSLGVQIGPRICRSRHSSGKRTSPILCPAAGNSHQPDLVEGRAMRRYIIEREMPNVGSLTAQGLADATRKSNSVLDQLGPGVQWVESYVTDDKIFCV